MLSRKKFYKVYNLNDEMRKMLTLAIEKLGLSTRWYYKILKVARTIAGLNNTENIDKSTIQEAISYRRIDKFIK